MKTDENSNWGGAREGAGRKPRLQYEARERFNEMFDKFSEKLVGTAIIQAAKGDKDMLRWLIEQRIGKAPQLVGVVRSAESPVPISGEELGAEVMEIAQAVSEELKRRKTA